MVGGTIGPKHRFIMALQGFVLFRHVFPFYPFNRYMSDPGDFVARILNFFINYIYKGSSARIIHYQIQ